jgi:SHS2 domain-containing protein
VTTVPGTAAVTPDATRTAYWEHFPHGADVGIRGVGKTMAEAFAQAAVALTGTVCDVESVKARRAADMACAAPTPELLLVDWINAIVYAMATEHMLFREFDVRIAGATLEAVARGESIDLARHEPAVEVKGATHTALRVCELPDGRWLAQCVIDV